jgi:hypothetical protein
MTETKKDKKKDEKKGPTGQNSNMNDQNSGNGQ